MAMSTSSSASSTAPSKARKLKHKLSLNPRSKSKDPKNSSQCADERINTSLFEEPTVPVANKFYSLLPALDPMPDVTATCNVFANAELLELAHCSQRPAATVSNAACRPPTRKSGGGIVAFDDQYQPPPSDHLFDTQLPISMTQLDRLCATAEAQEAQLSITEGTNNAPSSPCQARPSSSLVRVPRTVRETILQDFDCWSPQSQPSAAAASVAIVKTPDSSAQSPPTPVFKPIDLKRTYSHRRKSKRQLFQHPHSNASSSQSDQLDLMSDLDDDEVGAACVSSPPDNGRLDSPPVDLNLSGSVRKNILNLSQYYSQLSPVAANGVDEPATRPDDDISAVNETFASIMWSKACTLPSGDCSPGESRSFAGFGESITLQPNFNLLDTVSSSSGEAREIGSMDSMDDDGSNSELLAAEPQQDAVWTKERSPTTEPPFKCPRMDFGGFTTGLGTAIVISKSAVEMASRMYADCNRDKDNNTGPLLGGFKTGRGVSIAVSSTTAMAKSRAIFEECDADPDLQPIAIADAAAKKTALNGPDKPYDVPSAVGFSTGRGSLINVSAAALSRSRQIFDAEMCETHDKEASAFQTPCNKRSAARLISTPLNGSGPQSSTPFASAGFSTGRGDSITVSKAALERSSKVFLEELTPIKSDDLKTPVNIRPFPGSLTQEITASTKALIEDELLCSRMEDSLISCGEDVRKSVSSLRRTRLTSRFDAIDNHSPKQNQPHISAVAEHILAARFAAQQAQDEFIRTRKDARIQPGALYVRKMTGHRQKWPEFVHNERPSAAPSATPVVHYATASAYTFDMSAEMPSDDIDGLRLPDDIHVHLNAHNRIGLPELRRAFLCSSGVDPRLVPPAWLTHHYALIVHKLAAMERSFAQRLGSGRTLCVQNVAQQLKWRYDREVDRAQRSVVHRICERDAVPGARMVLFVLRSWSERECDLCDGHYAVRAVLDGELERLWRCGRIRVGTKLMVHGAELVGLNEGCTPLEIPPNVRLHIFANSTRRVRWHTRLGACRNPGPFRIGLDSVLVGGGRIGCLRLHIVRVYALLYVDKSKKDGSKTVIRSERVYQRDATRNAKHTVDLERIYSQVTREIELSEQPSTETKRSRLAATATQTRSISQLNDASQVCRILETAIDPEAIENQLSSTQKRDLCAYLSRRSDTRLDLINRRVRERTGGLNNEDDGRPRVTPLLRLRVVDASEDSADGSLPRKSAMLSVWNAHEDLLDMLHEGETTVVSGLSTCGVRNGDLQLSTNRKSNFKRLRSSAVHQRMVTHIAHIQQTPQFRPAFNEFDTVGVVVRVCDASNRKFQSVYVAAPSPDRTRPSAVLCINFWAGLHAFAFDDLVTVGRALAARDLQWREISGHSSVPCAFATEVTALTEHPRQRALAAAMAQLRSAIELVPMAQFVAECEQIIDAATSGRRRAAAANTGAMPSPQTTTMRAPGGCSSVVTPVPTVPQRIERLSQYVEPPEMSPMAATRSGSRRSGLSKRPHDE